MVFLCALSLSSLNISLNISLFFLLFISAASLNLINRACCAFLCTTSAFSSSSSSAFLFFCWARLSLFRCISLSASSSITLFLSSSCSFSNYISFSLIVSLTRTFVKKATPLIGASIFSAGFFETASLCLSSFPSPSSSLTFPYSFCEPSPNAEANSLCEAGFPIGTLFAPVPGTGG